MSGLKNNKLISLAGVFFFVGSSTFVNSFEFDSSMLEGMGIDSIDLSAFEGSNDQFLGEYALDIKINGMTILRDQVVAFIPNESGTEACISPDIIKRLPFDRSEISSNIIVIGDNTCYDLAHIDDAVSVDFSAENQQLDITVPQKYLANYDPYWIRPEDRDSGISGIFLDYSLLGTHSNNKYRDNENSLRSYGTIGANIGILRLRGNYQYDSRHNGDNGKLDWTQFYGFFDLANMNAKVYAGELNTKTNVFSSIRFKGITIHSDEDMMPEYLQGYSPQINGTANSNAIVTIKQHGAVIRSVQVAAGPFSISDLPSHLSGIVDVIIEENGSITKEYQIDVARAPFMTRPGTLRYSVNIGKLDPYVFAEEEIKVDDKLVSFDGSYGLTNIVSLYGGSQFTTNGNYVALNAGLGLNLDRFGALSFDITKAKNKALSDNIMKGYSYRFNYAKRFSQNTDLNLVGYRFSSRNYTSIHNYVDMKSSGNLLNTSLEKTRFTVSVSQQIPKINSSISVSMSKGSYWNKNRMSNYDINLNKGITKGKFKGTNVQFIVSRGTYARGAKETQYMVFLNIPLNDRFTKRMDYSIRYNDNSESVVQQIGYHDNIFDRGNLSLGATSSHHRDFSGSIDYSLYGSFDQTMAYGRIKSNIDYSENQKRISAGVDGSITVTKHGVATHNKVYEEGSRLIVDVGAAGVRMNGDGNKSNVFGLAGISNISGYYNNTYSVDNDNLPDNVEVSEGVVSLAVTDGAIAYRALASISGEKAITKIVLPDGTYPPFGSTVYRENGVDREVAIVAEEGLTYLTGLKANSVFTVKWNSVKSCHFNIKSLNPKTLEKITCYMD